MSSENMVSVFYCFVVVVLASVIPEGQGEIFLQLCPNSCVIMDNISKFTQTSCSSFFLPLFTQLSFEISERTYSSRYLFMECNKISTFHKNFVHFSKLFYDTFYGNK